MSAWQALAAPVPAIRRRAICPAAPSWAGCLPVPPAPHCRHRLEHARGSPRDDHLAATARPARRRAGPGFEAPRQGRATGRGSGDPYCLAMAPSRPLAAGEGALPLQSAAHGPSWALRALASAKEPQQRGCRGKKQGRSQPLAVPMVHERGQYAARGAAKEERRTAPRCKPFGEQQQAQARECADSWCLPIPWAAVDALQPPQQQRRHEQAGSGKPGPPFQPGNEYPLRPKSVDADDKHFPCACRRPDGAEKGPSGRQQKQQADCKGTFRLGLFGGHGCRGSALGAISRGLVRSRHSFMIDRLGSATGASAT